MEDPEKPRGRPSSIDKDIVQALNVLRGLDPFGTDDVDKLKAIELISSKPGGLDALLVKKYKQKPMSVDEKTGIEDRAKVREYYAKHPTGFDNYLAKHGFTSREDFEEKRQIVDSYPHLNLSPFLTDGSLDDIDNAVDQAIDAVIDHQPDVLEFSEFEDRVLYRRQVPESDISKIASFHFVNQQEGSEGKTFGQRLRKRSIQLDEDRAAVTDESKTKSDHATESW